MGVRLGVLMDDIASINFHKDSTLAMLWEAQSRGYELFYFNETDLIQEGETVKAHAAPLEVFQDEARWYAVRLRETIALESLDVVLMRKDPPFNMSYVYATYLLEQAQRAGVLVVNDPASLRSANEKLFALRFGAHTPATLVSSQKTVLTAFWQQHQDIILKPLDSMGGTGIFRCAKDEQNFNAITEVLTDGYQKLVMAQQFIPEIFTTGDKRILLVDGEPVEYALARIPAKGEVRGNLAVGGNGVGVELTAKDYEICRALASTLKKMGLLFVGIDVIGEYLTEVNVTSPTCIRELDKLYGLNIAKRLFDAIETRLN